MRIFAKRPKSCKLPRHPVSILYRKHTEPKSFPRSAKSTHLNILLKLRRKLQVRNRNRSRAEQFVEFAYALDGCAIWPFPGSRHVNFPTNFRRDDLKGRMRFEGNHPKALTRSLHVKGCELSKKIYQIPARG